MHILHSFSVNSYSLLQERSRDRKRDQSMATVSDTRVSSPPPQMGLDQGKEREKIQS